MQGLSPPETLDITHRQKWLKDSAFLEQLLDNKQVNMIGHKLHITFPLRKCLKQLEQNLKQFPTLVSWPARHSTSI